MVFSLIFNRNKLLMAGTRRFALGVGAQPDVEQILLEAHYRWLRTPEICELLRNRNNFRISLQPPNLPPSGSIFLFDRKVVRYFRNDGHQWRKKKDGKTVKESHEKLRAGSVNVLQCYYAHGEDNENFQRRCYWMLQEDLSNIVLVHYREVKSQKVREFLSWSCEEENYDLNVGSVPFQSHPSFSSTQTETIGNIPEQEHGIPEQLFAKSFGKSQEFGSHLQVHGECQTFENDSASKCPTDSNLAQDLASRFCEQDIDCVDLFKSFAPSCAHPHNQNDVQRQLPNAEHALILQSDSERISTVEEKSIKSGAIKQHLLGCSLTGKGLRKIESSCALMIKELAGADENHVQFSSEAYRETVESETRIDDSSIPTQPHFDTSVQNPSLSEDQLCDIIDFTKNWAYVGSETETSENDSCAHQVKQNEVNQLLDFLSEIDPDYSLMEEDLKKTENSNGLISKDLETLAPIPSSSPDQLSSIIALSPNWELMGSEVEIAEIDFAHSSKLPMDHQSYPDSEDDLSPSFPGIIFSIFPISTAEPSCAHLDEENDHQIQLSDTESESLSESETESNFFIKYKYLFKYEYLSESETESNLTIEEHISVGSQTDEGLNKELGDVTESENWVDDSSIPAQVPQYCCSSFGISPNWEYVDAENKVFIMGRFLMSQAEIIADAFLHCRPQASGSLHMQFGKLCLSSVATPNYNPENVGEVSQLGGKVSSLIREDTDDWGKMLER